MIISHRKRFIFIHLEKCGGTSVEAALEPHLGWDDIIFGSTKFGDSLQEAYFDRYGPEEVKKNYLWKHSSAINAYRYIGAQKWSEYKRVSVVREPVELIKSLYNYSNKVVDLHINKVDEFWWRERFERKDFPNVWPFRDKYIQAFVASKINHAGIDGFINTIILNNYDVVKPQIERLTVNKSSVGRFTTKGGIGDLGMVVDLSQLNDKWQEMLKYIGIHHKDTKLDKLNNTDEYSKDLDISEKNIKKIKKHFIADYKHLHKYTGVEW